MLKHQNEFLSGKLQHKELTGLAQSKVVRITPIKGVTVTIFEVNLGKNSFDSTAKQNNHKVKA